MTDIAIAILVDGDKVLMGRRAAHKAAYPNCWDFVGGHVEKGETLTEALTREMTEEIAVRPIAPVFLDQMVDRALGLAEPPTYHFFIVRHWTGGTPTLANHEHTELRWVSFAEMRMLNRLSDDAYLHYAARAIAHQA